MTLTHFQTMALVCVHRVGGVRVSEPAAAELSHPLHGVGLSGVPAGGGGTGLGDVPVFALTINTLLRSNRLFDAVQTGC